MAKPNKGNIIIWAVDPTEDPKDSRNLVKEMRLWSKHLGCKIQPASIFSKNILDFPFDTSHPQPSDTLVRIEKSILHFIRKAGATDCLPPEIVLIKDSSKRKKAVAIAELAKERQASMIFANTHAPKALAFLRIGGFAETLIGVSTVPVLLLNPSSTVSQKSPSILFPTDFSKESRNALDSLADWAKSFRAKVVLFNLIEGPAYYAPEAAGYAAMSPSNWEFLFEEIEVARKKHAQAWTKQLREKGVDSTFIIQRQRKAIVTDILEAAKENKTPVIALASHAGPVARFFIGSIARDVLLRAKCPVIVWHRPKGLRKYKEPIEQAQKASFATGVRGMSHHRNLVSPRI